MKFKALKGTETFAKLQAVWLRIKKADKAAKQLAIELNADTRWMSGWGSISGGISGIELKVKPEGWKSTGENGFYYPAKLNANKELLDRLEALPVVKDFELNDAVGFKRQSVGRVMHNCIGAQFGKDYHLFEVNEEVKYTPPADVIEITASEYKKLSLKK